MPKLILIISCLLCFSCASRKKQTPPDTSKLIQLETTGCFGFCPVYKLLFFNDGSLEFEGINNTEIAGKMKAVISREELKALQKQVKETHLRQYPERIKSQVADAPSAYLTLFEGEQSYKVFGGIDRPQPLLDLEENMKKIAEKYGMPVRKGVNPNAPPPNAPTVIVKLKPELNAGNWIVQFSEIKIRLKRRLGADNIWLVEYDPRQVTEKQLLELLKSAEGVLEAQGNKKVEERN